MKSPVSEGNRICTSELDYMVRFPSVRVRLIAKARTTHITPIQSFFGVVFFSVSLFLWIDIDCSAFFSLQFVSQPVSTSRFLTITSVLLCVLTILNAFHFLIINTSSSALFTLWSVSQSSCKFQASTSWLCVCVFSPWIFCKWMLIAVATDIIVKVSVHS